MSELVHKIAEVHVEETRMGPYDSGITYTYTEMRN